MSENQKCVIYARVSTLKQATTGGSIQSQKAILTKGAQAKGWDIVGIFEEAKSAKNNQSHGVKISPSKLRKQFAEAKKLCEQTGAFLLINDVDRLARCLQTSLDTWQTIDIYDQREKRILPYDVLLQKAAQAQRENEIKGERVKERLEEEMELYELGKRKKWWRDKKADVLARGEKYDDIFTPEQIAQSIKTNKEAAENENRLAISIILTKKNEGLKPEQIAQYLNLMGVKPRFGKKLTKKQTQGLTDRDIEKQRNILYRDRKFCTRQVQRLAKIGSKGGANIYILSKKAGRVEVVDLHNRNTIPKPTKEFLTMVENGVSGYKLTNYLNDKGIKTDNGKEWSRKTLLAFLYKSGLRSKETDIQASTKVA